MASGHPPPKGALHLSTKTHISWSFCTAHRLAVGPKRPIYGLTFLPHLQESDSNSRSVDAPRGPSPPQQTWRACCRRATQFLSTVILGCSFPPLSEPLLQRLDGASSGYGLCGASSDRAKRMVARSGPASPCVSTWKRDGQPQCVGLLGPNEAKKDGQNTSILVRVGVAICNSFNNIELCTIDGNLAQDAKHQNGALHCTTQQQGSVWQLQAVESQLSSYSPKRSENKMFLLLITKRAETKCPEESVLLEFLILCTHHALVYKVLK